MGWLPGHPIAYSVHGHLIAVRGTDAGASRFKIGALGQIWLPAQVLRATALRPGDPVVLLALPTDGALAIIPAPLVQEALSIMVAEIVGAV
ncbi:AbrB/MazE/SpoVT family DNA-binding domain-containing protein [Nocardia noduli]|uniref:AbrB/MazE/SpoVT family DNA-binding domain-containing protein n=1 Tax=Nocardia noduli TaxID=2815722 RepID=UPI001C2126BE|nr:AbrB/MazE/SpoVT family DNA-binding domain-containing protein [Nocardia noduli]